MRRENIRNLVIIAHVDHGKTTLVDCLLRQSGQFRESQLQGERILDSNDQERERGITILAKNCAIPYRDIKINVIDTPGHADFGGEVERVVRMADGALVLVDAAEGPMPQTRFVLSKALEAGLQPIIVVNKIDRPDARPLEVVDEVMELLMELDAEHHIDDLPYVFTSAKAGFATLDPNVPGQSMQPLLDLIVDRVPGPVVQEHAPLQMLVTTIDWSSYVGRVAIGRIRSGTLAAGQRVAVLQAEGKSSVSRVAALQVFENLERVDVAQASAGEIVAVVGLEEVDIGDTIASVENPQAITRIPVDLPTLEMVFSINTSPFVGRDGKYVTTRQLRERLFRELESNVALQVEPIEGSDAYAVRGRGVMHLAVLIEAMRREGYELSLGKPRVITRKEGAQVLEPFETLVIEVPHDRLGPVMELVGQRRGDMKSMGSRGEFALVTFSIPARGLIGLRTRVLNATAGTAMMHHRFEAYRPQEGDIPHRANGVLISNASGKANAYGLDGLQDRAELFVGPGTEVYEGMVVGENSRGDDMTVNPTREKKLTNIRAAGSDDNILLKPPRVMSLESALEYIEADELLEVTPNHLRFRKRLLRESDRRREKRSRA
jgi:GTP-binding protein